MGITRKKVAATMAAATTAAIGFGAQAANASTTTDHVRPDINRSSCLGNPLKVIQSDGLGEDCFENAGNIGVTIYNIDSVYTGNNGTSFILSDKGTLHWCDEPVKDTYISAEECGGTWNESTMSFLSIYPGSS